MNATKCEEHLAIAGKSTAPPAWAATMRRGTDYLLRLQRGLITDDMHRWVRHPNYLGEMSDGRRKMHVQTRHGNTQILAQTRLPTASNTQTMGLGEAFEVGRRMRIAQTGPQLQVFRARV